MTEAVVNAAVGLSGGHAVQAEAKNLHDAKTAAAPCSQTDDHVDDRHKSAAGRSVCDGCSRPSTVCLCAVLPKQPLPCPCEIILLQHPKERKQKNRSAWIAERCISGVRTVVGKRLVERNLAPPQLDRLWSAPDKCAVVFPSVDAQPLEDVVGSVDVLLFLDATWKYAQEMLKSSTVLEGVRKVRLSAPEGVTPQFLVRKPLQLTGSVDAEDTAAEHCNEDGAAPTRWGFCTAEAVALAVDVVRKPKPTDDKTGEETKLEDRLVCEASDDGEAAWRAVSAVVRGHVNCQLTTMAAQQRQVKHRPNRPGYVPDLFKKLGQDAGFVTAATELPSTATPDATVLPSESA
eukprot:TRINITY_DN40376_c0_g1_i1.p1 TRINITY_DN40376_c0_g1~~TRINITY_DN40376_c0_g1_i1.p1  ORF type:complete len:357 (+),score=64.07 TRINITY_DN40376_c0_g1_i1:36-1073(+)